MSFTPASSQARALAHARTAALVNGYRNFLSLFYLGLLLSALERNKSANTANRLADRTSALFDLSDRKTQSLDAAGNATAYAYAPQEIPLGDDPTGNVTRITSPDAYSVSFDYAPKEIPLGDDPMNRVIRAADEEGNAVTKELDLDGKPRKVTDANGTSTLYDYYDGTKNGKLFKVTDAGNRWVSYDYDENGNVITVIDNAGRSTLSFYDELNRPSRTVGPQVTDPTFGLIRTVTLNSFDTLGNLTQVSAGRTDTGGVTPSNDVATPQQVFAFDDFGRKIKETDAVGKFWRYRYDDNGNLTQATDPKGQLTTLAYGYGGALLTRVNAAGTISYTRNALGQVTLAQSPEVSYSRTYDAAHRLASLTDSRGNKTLTYSWSPGGRLNRLTGTDIGSTDYRYDAAGRLTTLWDSQDSYLAYLYDQGARLKQKWLANGVTSEYVYNADNTLAQLKNSAYDFNTFTYATLTQHDLTYDSLGRKQTAKDKVGAFTQPVQNIAYGFDPLGNRITKNDVASGILTSYVHDAATNQLKEIHAGGIAGALIGALIYDDAGNLVQKCEGGSVTANATSCTGSAILNLQYNADNRIAQASGNGVNESYGYDDQGRRIRKTSNGSTTFYLYNGPDIVAEYEGNWSKPKVMVTHGPGTDDPVVRYTRNTGGTYDKRYYHQDTQNSSVAVTDANGTLVGTQLFDPWGNKLASGTLGNVERYGYTGREPDATGLIYYRARYYDPGVARFTQRDPIGLAGGMNQYAYVGNSPVNYTDPSGTIALFDNAVGGLLNVAIGAGITCITSRCSDYGWRQGGIDFAVGFATNGLSAFVAAKQLSRLSSEAKGVLGRELAEAQFAKRGEAIIGEEIVVTSPGAKPRFDYIVESPSGKFKAVEVKNGPTARVSSAQGKTISFIEEGGSGTAVGKAAAEREILGQSISEVEVLHFNKTGFSAGLGDTLPAALGLDLLYQSATPANQASINTGLGAFGAAMPSAPYSGGLGDGLAPMKSKPH